jgi:hypothetical protein
VKSTGYAELTVVREGDVTVVASRPNTPSATAKAAAAGYLTITVVYDPRGQTKEPGTIQIARRLVFDGDYDWDAPEATITAVNVRRIKAYEATIGPYAHNASVLLAVRAVAADGTPSEIFELPAAAADQVPPDAQSYIAAEPE